MQIGINIALGTNAKIKQSFGPDLVLETDSPTNDWAPWVDDPILTAATDHRPGSNGTKSLDLKIAASRSGATAERTITTEAGKSYKLSFWYKNFDAIGIIFSIYDKDFNVLLNVLGLNSTEWTHVNARINCTVTGDTYLLPIVGGEENQHGRVDDITLKEIL